MNSTEPKIPHVTDPRTQPWPDTTEGMSWPDTLRWLAEHDGEDIKVKYKTNSIWIKWDGEHVHDNCMYRLARRKPRVGKMGVHHKGDVYQEVDAVELIPGMVVLERMPTMPELHSAITNAVAPFDWHKRLVELLNNLKVDIDE